MFQPLECCLLGAAGFSPGNLATLCGGGGGRWATCAEASSGPLEANSHPADNHDIISMKLFQLMVEHTPDEENIDWTKIEPSVNLLKSPKGMHLQPLLVGPGPARASARGPSALPWSNQALGSANSAHEQVCGHLVSASSCTQCWDNGQ